MAGDGRRGGPPRAGPGLALLLEPLALARELELPDLPDLPDLPELLDLPELPALLDLPELPALLDLPGLPALLRASGAAALELLDLLLLELLL